MNEAKIIKNIDELGRLGIPKHIRRALGVNDGEPVELFLEGNALIIKKSSEECLFCESNEELTYFKGKYICKECIARLSEL